jgi:hypothetical protein
VKHSRWWDSQQLPVIAERQQTSGNRPKIPGVQGIQIEAALLMGTMQRR